MIKRLKAARPYKLAQHLLCSIAYGLLSTSANALVSSNQHPLIHFYGLPDIVSTSLPVQNHWQHTLFTDTANFSNQSTRSNEQLLIDGELARIALSSHFGIGKQQSIGLTIEAVHISGGVLDSTIENWHSTFDFPNGNRDQRPRDVLDISYSRAGSTILQLTGNHHGIGDLQLSYRRQLFKSTSQQTALQLSIKLPTGDRDKLTGSGSTDLDLSFAFKYDKKYGSLWGHSGILAMNNVGVLEQYRRDIAAHIELGASTQPWRKLSFNAQINVHTAFYDSQLKDIGQEAALLSFGITRGNRSNSSFTIYACEDIAVNTAPDFAIGLQATKTW